MTSNKQNPRESSLALALAELEALERDRAEFVESKRQAGELLRRQGRDIDALRGRLEAERPRAWARARRREARARLAHARALAAASARSELEHRERLARHAADLEAKRRTLAELESEPEGPGLRLLAWGMPLAAAGMVAFMAMTLLGEDETVARVGADVDAVELAVSSSPGKHEAPNEAMMIEGAPTPLKAELDPPKKVKARASKSEPKEERRASQEGESSKAEANEAQSGKDKSGKDKSSKSKSRKSKSDEDKGKNKKTSPGVKKHSNPLILEDLDGNPLR